jgi:two-component system OmpR family response regulator
MSRILVIDDEPIVLDLIAISLTLSGHEVTAFGNPLEIFEAPELLRTADLLITDVSMRPIDGFEVVKRLNTDGLCPPVLFMSGYPAVAAAIAQNRGEKSVIEKPFTVEQLRNAVRRALETPRGNCTCATC